MLVVVLAFVLASPLVAFSPGYDVAIPEFVASAISECTFVLAVPFFVPQERISAIGKDIPVLVSSGGADASICVHKYDKAWVKPAMLAGLMCGIAPSIYFSANIAMDNYVRFDPRTRMQALARDETFQG